MGNLSCRCAATNLPRLWVGGGIDLSQVAYTCCKHHPSVNFLEDREESSDHYTILLIDRTGARLASQLQRTDLLVDVGT